MAANLGALTVSLGLDAAEYTRGLTKAEKDAYAFGESIGKGIRSAAVGATAALAALGASAAGAFALLNKQADQIASFQGLSEKIGDTASAVQGLKLASDLSDVSLASVATASVKLTSELAKTVDTTTSAGAAIKALGLDLKEFKSLTPTEQLKAAADAMSGFQDGAGKTAVAVALFGRAGADLIPFLNDLAESGRTNIRLTNEQIKSIDDHQKASARLKSEIESLGQLFAVQVFDSITAFTGALTDLGKEMLGVGQGADGLAKNRGVQQFADDAVIFLANVIDIARKAATVFQFLGESVGATAAIIAAASSGSSEGAKAAFSFSPSGALNTAKQQITDINNIIKDAREQGKKYTAESISMADTVAKKIAERNALGRQRALNDWPGRPGTPGNVLDFSNAKTKPGSKDDPTKKILDNQIKELDRAFKQEEDLLASRNKVLDLYYGQSLVSIEDYYATRQANAAEATAKEVALIDQQIAALEKYKAAASKESDRVEAQGKINALLDKEADLQRKAGEASVEQSVKKVQAQLAYKDSIDGVRASLLELQGNAGAAAQIRVEIQYRDLLTKATSENDAAAKRLIETLKAQTVAQAGFNTEATNASQVMARLQIDEDRIALARQLGSTSELGALQQLGTARQAAVVQLQSIVATQEAIAKASGNPALVLQAEQGRLALEKLAATADPLADKFKTIFTDSFGDAFADFITGTKSAKEAFASFAESVLKQLARMAAQDTAQGLWKAFFGDSVKTTSSGGGGGFFSTIADWILGKKANGGPVSAGGLYQVSENRPEMLDVNGKSFLMMGNQRGNINPNPSFGGGGTVINNFTVGDVATVGMLKQALAESQAQTAAAAARSQSYRGRLG